ncbi:MAG: nuclear transport factor 2 family protein [Mycobacterium sp.]
MGVATPAVIERWLSVIVDGHTADLDALLAEDAVFYSPAVFTPQHGRAKAATYLRAAEQMFSNTGFHYVDMWFADGSAVLEFAAEIDGVTVEGIDLIRWNTEDRITSVKVMIRPIKALQAVVSRMAEILPSI